MTPIVKTPKHLRSVALMQPIFEAYCEAIKERHVDPTDPETYADMVTDLLHLAASNGVAAADVLNRGEFHFENEAVVPDDLAFAEFWAYGSGPGTLAGDDDL